MAEVKDNPLEMAKKGDCKSIDVLINQQLRSKGILARSIAHNGCLHITVEAEVAPRQDELVNFLQQGIRKLGSKAFIAAEICGKSRASGEIIWKTKFNLQAVDKVEDPSASTLTGSKNTSANVKDEYDYPIELKGSNGILQLENDKITIIRKGGVLSTQKKGCREIPYSDILSYQYAPPQGFSQEGFFYFQLGENVPEIAKKDSLLNENSIKFANLQAVQDELLPKINAILSTKVLTKKKNDLFFLGDNGGLTITDKSVIIHRSKHNLSSASVGDKNIPFRSITAVQFNKAEKTFLGWISGFIQFTIQGGIEKQGNLSALSDENSVTFKTEEANDEFARAKKIIEAKIQEAYSAPQNTKTDSSNLADLEKLANLRDRGIVTEAEFQAKKKQLLGL